MRLWRVSYVFKRGFFQRIFFFFFSVSVGEISVGRGVCDDGKRLNVQWCGKEGVRAQEISFNQRDSEFLSCVYMKRSN
ncbi:hypothetical protein COLO4_16297 [Corchorus olitorius]|uniref:Uncharacterized protein n=1 Tax=Corchorus olitorius TaxID=93759 RepID=A0A1R3JI72_9ROSI|nr:hypothetical protein COLO4_16297 [Corchorus olitorius]